MEPLLEYLPLWKKSETQRLHGSLLQSVLRQLNHQAEPTNLPDGVRLPLKTQEDLDNFEEKASSTSFQTAMVSEFLLICQMSVCICVLFLPNNA